MSNGQTVRWESTAKIFCVLVDASVVFVGFSVWLAVARHDMTCPRWLPVLATTTFALYLGWNSIAVFANTAGALISSGVSASVTWWQFVVLGAAAVFAWG
jgi:hypothetical protein